MYKIWLVWLFPLWHYLLWETWKKNKMLQISWNVQISHFQKIDFYNTFGTFLGLINPLRIVLYRWKLYFWTQGHVEKSIIFFYKWGLEPLKDCYAFKKRLWWNNIKSNEDIILKSIISEYHIDLKKNDIWMIAKFYHRFFKSNFNEKKW